MRSLFRKLVRRLFKWTFQEEFVQLGQYWSMNDDRWDCATDEKWVLYYKGKMDGLDLAERVLFPND
jgi:hypothetical protein